MTAPKEVSVAMGTFDGARYLREQLDSLNRQTLLPAELIVHDDGSRDDTLRILGYFAKSASFPVHVQRNERTLGYADNFLTCAAGCGAPLIAFCDQDDVWDARKLERCAAEFASPEVSLVIHGGVVTDGDLCPTGLPAQRGLTSRRRLRRIAAYPGMILHGMRMVFRRELMVGVPWKTRPASYEMTAEPTVMAHDRWIPFLASFLGETILIPDNLILYRQHPDNAVGIGRNTALNSQLKTQLHFAASTSGDVYHKWAALASGCADFLDAMVEKVDPSIAPRVRDGACYFRLLAEAQSARAILYSSTRRGRVRLLGNMIAAGRYSSREQGGLGLKSLAKDVVSLARPKIDSSGLLPLS